MCYRGENFVLAASEAQNRQSPDRVGWVHDQILAGHASEPATARQRIEHAKARNSWGTQEPPASSIECSVLNPEHVFMIGPRRHRRHWHSDQEGAA
jgi:hypothetical protein